MGLNMPARTVIFTGMKKFDGVAERWLSSGEGWGFLEVCIGLNFGSKKTEFLNKSSKTIDILTVFFEPK